MTAIAEDVARLPGGPFPNPDLNGVSPASEWDFDAQDAQDLTPKEVRGIKWRGREYVLRAASADAVIKFNNKRFQQARMDDGKLVAVAGGAELPYFLVGMCLYEVSIKPADGSELLKAVREDVLRAVWPPHFIDKLYAKALEISHIDDDSRNLDKRIADLEKQLKRLYAERAKRNGVPQPESTDSAGRDTGGSDGGLEQLVHIDKTGKEEDRVGNS